MDADLVNDDLAVERHLETQGMDANERDYYRVLELLTDWYSVKQMRGGEDAEAARNSLQRIDAQRTELLARVKMRKGEA